MRNVKAQKMQHRHPPKFRMYGGFSLFELVVFIISVAIIYAAAARRFAEFPGQAERANFLAVMIEVQTAVSLEIMLGINAGRYSNVVAFEGANPMELLLVPPRNYIGAMDISDSTGLPRRTWYFNTRSEELIYLIEDNENVSILQNEISIPAEEIRFKLQVQYRFEDTVTGLPVEILNRTENIVPEENQRKRVSGVAMLPVYPFNWEGSDPSTLIREATEEISG